MDFGKMLSNPWVIGGGLGLGVLLLLLRGSASTGTSAADPNVIGLIASNNALGAQVVAQQASAAVSIAQVTSGNIATVAAFLENAGNMQAQLNAQNNQTNAGVLNNIIQTGSAQAIDFNTNAARSRDTVVNAESAVAIAKLNANAVKSAANSNMIGTISGAVAKTANAVAAMIAA